MGSNHTDVVPSNVRGEAARRGILHSDLAAACGLSTQAFSRRMTGAVQFDVGHLRALAERLGVQVSVLLDPPSGVAS